MALTQLRFLFSLIIFALAFPCPPAAFDTPVSDTGVRQAYFLGQRHDETFGRFLDSYYKHLPSPKTGPYISSVAFLTPYALLTEFASQQPYGYSAQQLELDHRGMVETVKVIVEIQLTDSYPAVMPNPVGRTSGTPWRRIQRPGDFWRDFQIKVVSNGKNMVPFTLSGEPNYVCGDSDFPGLAIGEYCALVGATVQMEFLADAFATDSAEVLINPPEGDSVAVDFDLYALR
jgi:hypothetical protein